jgi:serine-type D-Ala-D-Ala carboxypeptidase/endopeptidase (penicillin-binding protein 4)
MGRLNQPTRILVTAAAVLCVGWSVTAVTAEAKPSRPSAQPTLRDRLLAAARRGPVRSGEWALTVQRIGDAQPLVAIRPDTPLILASTTKVFTTAAAIDRLGADYRFRTSLFVDDDVTPDGRLAGPLIVRGGGDPAISGRLYDDDPLAVFRPWASALTRRGIKRIQGGLLLDVSFFDDQKIHPDWPSEQEQRWYQAPTAALSYNDNVVLVRATGGLRPGAPAILGFYPAGPHLLSLISQVRTISGGGARVGVRRAAGSRTVVASGLVGNRRTWTGDVTVPDPPLYFASALTQVLRESGIEVEAPPSVRVEPLPTNPKRTLLHTHETPIVPVLSVCNKRSQSFYAEQILKTLGAERRGKGTWENGEREVAEFLRSLGLDPARYQLADGSGRSRNNRASAEAYVDFLVALATRWSRFAAFEPTLAVSGDQDGSLRHRLLGADTRGKVHAKTGNIAGVVTLCGYVTARSGERYAFSILINGGCPEGRGHSWQDRFVTELARWG